MAYIGNKNTKRLHAPGCRAVPMIAPKHLAYSDNGEGFPVPCKWCGNKGHKKGGYQMTFDEYEILNMPEMKVCYDDRYIQIFEKTGCIQHIGDGDKFKGMVLMYPHDNGVPVDGEDGLWWVFFQCSTCGYQTALWKALKKIEKM